MIERVAPRRQNNRSARPRRRPDPLEIRHHNPPEILSWGQHIESKRATKARHSVGRSQEERVDLRVCQKEKNLGTEENK